MEIFTGPGRRQKNLWVSDRVLPRRPPRSDLPPECSAGGSAVTVRRELARSYIRLTSSGRAIRILNLLAALRSDVLLPRSALFYRLRNQRHRHGAGRPAAPVSASLRARRWHSKIFFLKGSPAASRRLMFRWHLQSVLRDRLKTMTDQRDTWKALQIALRLIEQRRLLPDASARVFSDIASLSARAMISTCAPCANMQNPYRKSFP